MRREVTRVVSTLTGKLEAAEDAAESRVGQAGGAACDDQVHRRGRARRGRAPAGRCWRRRLPSRRSSSSGAASARSRTTKHPRALWLGVINGAAPLAQVEAEVSRRLAGQGRRARRSRASCRISRSAASRWPGVGVDWPKILQAVEVKHVTSVVDRVTLYRSELSQQGPHYTGLVSAPLIGTAT